MPSPGFRKLAIILTIVVIVAHPTCGFTLHRKTTAEADPGPTTDLASQESLQVKYVRSPNDIKQGKDADTNKATKSKYRFNDGLKFIDSTEETAVNDIKEAETTQDSPVSDITTTQDVPTKVPKETRTSTSVTDNTDQGIKPTISANTSGSTANSSSESREYVTVDLHNTKSTNYSEASSTTKEIRSTKLELLRTKLNNITSTVGVNRRESEVKSITNLPTINDQIAIDSETTDLTVQKEPNTNLKTESDKIPASTVAGNSRKSEVESITDVPTINDQKAIDLETPENLTAPIDPNTNSTTENFTEISNTDIDAETTKFLASSEINEKPNITLSETVTTADSTTSQSSKPESTLFPDETSISASTIVEVKVTKDSSQITTESPREQNTMIKRKLISSSEEISSRTEKDKDSVKAESIQTTLPIPSLEMLREDMLFNANQFSTARESQTGSVVLETTMMPTIESIESIQSETLGTVASKRAGFLDLSKITSTHYEDTTTDKNTYLPTESRIIHQVEATDIEAQEIKKVNGYESQSQLAEDAIKEELLKEEIISNHEENANRYEDGKDGFKQHADKAKNVESTISQTVTEDTLSVQPINQARRTTLYTVGPNYKPMKRIEVQQAKPFVRDPDDNSWRNESISSLGIVFKPKNTSSKSFKEVLKTKTETEFNNLQDKDNKDDTPELRERLEKITEVRKKKKKIDKFGEVVYTDYEEGSSAEGTGIPKAETTPTAVSSSEIPSTLSSRIPEVEVTSPMTTTENHRYWKNKLETISKEDMFKELGLDILTTEKTKKPYNLAEYYDTTDEYDADYITQTKIDLKKFTVPLKTTFPSLTSPPMPPPTTRFKAPRFPERKPTVQYFPPTTKPQKVNVNDYDVDFERRVQLYTLQETQTPKTILPDVASMPEATDRPRIRPTVKAADFTMITPQSPDSLSKHVYMSNDRVTEPHNFVISNGNLNRGTYVIKHFRDFLNDAAQEDDDVRSPDFVPYTEPPARGVTLDELARATDKGTTTEADYEYDNQFRKEVLSRFVDNFNQNSDRFKVDFPVLFNSSVVHRSNDDQGRVLASSSTFIKRLYGNELTATRPPKSPSSFLMNKGCENCDNITVELSPAYELHYYVPEQEEKEEMEQRPAALPYRYNL